MRNGKLKGLVFSTGKSQRQVAVEAKIPEGKLSNVINGKGELTTKERRSLARVLKIDEAALDEQTIPLTAK